MEIRNIVKRVEETKTRTNQQRAEEEWRLGIRAVFFSRIKAVSSR